MGAWIEISITVALLALGYFWGSRAERKHYLSLTERERTSTDVIVIASRHAPENAQNGELVLGNVVIASDYFKRFVSWLIGIFGGRINVYESLLDRARREAMLRMKDEAKSLGANMVVNVKIETATINNSKNQSTAMVEVLAYGTAVKHLDTP